MKAKVSPILFLIILIAPALVTYCWIKYRQSEVRHEVKKMIIKGIDKDELVLLKFSKKDVEEQLEWEHSKEFEYNEQMYDVVESKVIGDTTYYWCWWDNDETKLNKQLSDLAANAFNNDPQKNEKQNRLISFYKALYFEQEKNWTSFVTIQEHQLNVPYRVSFSWFTLTPPVPPPQS